MFPSKPTETADETMWGRCAMVRNMFGSYPVVRPREGLSNPVNSFNVEGLVLVTYVGTTKPYAWPQRRPQGRGRRPGRSESTRDR